MQKENYKNANRSSSYEILDRMYKEYGSNKVTNIAESVTNSLDNVLNKLGLFEAKLKSKN